MSKAINAHKHLANAPEKTHSECMRKVEGKWNGILAAVFLGVAGFMGSNAVLAASDVAAEPAWKEEVITPHWEWGKNHSGGTVKALCVTNEEAVFDPEELALREDMEITTLGVGGQQSARTIDQKKFQAALDNPCDVVIFATESGWNSLSAESREKLFQKIKGGLSVIVRGFPKEHVGSEFKDLLSRPSVMDKKAAANEAAGSLPAASMPFRQSLAIQWISEGAGRILIIDGYTSTTHWTWSNAFTPNLRQPHLLPYDEDRAKMELYYAFAARTARWAAGKQGPVKLGASVLAENAPVVGSATSLRIPWEGEKKEGDQLCWNLYSPQGDFLASGEWPASDSELSLTPSQSGRLLLRWNAVRDNKTLDYGATFLDVKTPAALANLSAPEKIQPESGVDIQWGIDGGADKADQVVAQLYDPDGGLMSVGEAPAAAGKMTLPGWVPHFASHRLRVLLLRGGLVLDEKRLPVQVVLNREDDRKTYHAIVWSSESGIYIERKRLQLLRDFGMTALANIGRSINIAREASEEGLRLVPTSVLVPKPNYDAQKEEKGIKEYSELVSKYTPIGYSLADEPNQKIDAVDFRNRGAEIIRQADPQVPVGYCGVWQGFDKDVPRFFESCDFVEAYSPLHLYDLNIWSGNERDLCRSFRQPTGLLTSWTHYTPWADHEPYTRTVPWLWLFDEMNGVSYFSSGGEFAILPPDLRSTHESRWLSSEMAELQRGIGEQVIAMRRDHGAVRILFTPNAEGCALWAKALNQTHIPYRFVSHKELAAGLGGEVRFLICPNLLEVSGQEVKQMEAIAKRGGVVLSTAPIGAVDTDGSIAAQALFGFKREGNAAASTDDWKKQASIRSNVIVKTDWKPNGIANPISGRSLGESRVKPSGAAPMASFLQVGEKTLNAAEQHDFVRDIFSLAAVLQKQTGKGNTLYLTFQPDLDSLKNLLPGLLVQVGIPTAAVRVEMADKRDDTVYLFPFQKENVHLVGVVPDYIRRLPASSVEGGKETRLYYQHGPRIWNEDDAQIVTNAPAHLYDVRRGSYLGFTSRAFIKIKGGRPELFAFLPYKIEQLSLTCADRAKAGDTLNVAVKLSAKEGVPGLHLVHVALTDPQGRQTASEQRNVHTSAGNGSVKISLPFNALPGQWKIIARDAITGVNTEKPLQVVPSEKQVGSVLEMERVTVKKTATDWPEGKLAPYSEKPQETVVSVKPLRTVPMRTKGHEMHKSLNSAFSLTNSLISYGVCYSACNDTAAHQESDPRKAWGGIGFNRPNANSWYYNNYIQITLDDMPVGTYAISEIKQEKAGDDGKVVATWNTPKGKVDLIFILPNDHRGVFQELRVYNVTEPIRTLGVKFNGYYWGIKAGDKQSDGFITFDPSGQKAWALMGNKVNEPAYGKGSGACALRILPEELTSVDLNKRAIEKQVNLTPGQTASVHWVLWTFPDFSNAKALEYMNSDSASGVSREKLLKLFKQAR